MDRFVLGPARQARRPAAIALLASVRTGIIAALLLGPAAAIGVGARLPGLVQGPRDAAVIAVYMGVLFGAAVFIVSCGATLLVSAFAGDRAARRARVSAFAAGGVVTIGCLAYLTLWWRTANTGLTASGWSTGLALAVAVAISLILGHAARLTALAVILAGRADAMLDRDRASWRVSVGSGILAFAGASVLLVVTAPASGGDRPPASALTVVSSGLRVRLIAIDGIDPAVLAPLAAAGRVPALAAAFGAARARVGVDTSRDPARSWTTIATGQPPDVHGVHTLETRTVAGVQGVASGEPSALGSALRAATDLLRLTRPSIASGSQRREKTLWEVAADAGLRIAVVNWWATWPAPSDDRPDGAIVLSDRATLRLEIGGTLDAEIAPARLYDRLRAEWPSLRQHAALRSTTTLGSIGSSDPAVQKVLQRSAELDTIQLLLAEIVAKPQPDLLAIYLPGLDIAQHALLGQSEGVEATSTVAARVDGLRDYYVFLDRLLSDMLTPTAGDLVVVVTEPGRVSTGTEGTVGISGSVARRDAQLDGRATDVMPTVLHVLGVPVSQALAGGPLTGLLDEAYLKRYPVRYVPTYGHPSAPGAARKGQPLDQEMIDRLRSLGYVK